MRDTQHNDFDSIAEDKNKRKESWKKKVLRLARIAIVSVALLSIGSSTTEVDARATDSHANSLINKHVKKYSDYYQMTGYFYYQSYMSQSKSYAGTYYESGKGKWTDSKPKNVSGDLYSPDRNTSSGNRYFGPMADWGFSPHSATWVGSRLYENGKATNSNVQYSREVSQIYRRNKTSPTSKGATITGANYVSGNDYWVKPNTTIQIKQHGYQNYPGSKLALDDYVRINHLRLSGNGTEVKARLLYDGSFSYFTPSDHFGITKNATSRSNGNRDLYTTFNVTPKKNSGTYVVATHSASANGKEHGYIDTNKRIKIDSTNPTGSLSPSSGNSNGNIKINLSSSDVGAGVKQWRYREYNSTTGWGAWKAWVSGTSGSVTLSNQGSNKIQVQFNDHVGNTGTVDSGTYIIDKTAPTLNVSNSTPAWTNGSVTLNVSASDSGGSGFKNITLPNASTTTKTSATYVVNGNGTYTFKATDNVGNTTTKSITVSNRDTTAPGGTISGNPTAWTKNNVTLTLNATDSGGAGVKNVKTPNGTTVNGSTASYTVSANGTYNFTVYDNAGNSKIVSSVVNLIDKTVPALNVSKSNSSWTNGNVSLDATASDTQSGLNYITIPNGTKDYTSPASQTVSSNGTYVFKAIDKVGNETSQSVSVTNIDKTAPSGTISGNPTAWTKDNITLTLTPSDTGGSGYYRTKLPDGSFSTSTKPTYPVSSNGTYNFVVYDNAGNSTTVSAAVTKIDKTVPGGTISGNPTAWTNQNATLTLTTSDGGGSGYYRTKLPDGSFSTSTKPTYPVSSNGTYNFVVYDNAGNSTTVSAAVTKIDKTVPGGTISGNPTAWTNQNATLKLSATDGGGSGYYRTKLPDGTYSTSATPTYTVTGNGTYNFVVYDNAGNAKTISVSVTKIDKTVPGGTISGNPTAWTKNSVTLTLKPTDVGSGYYRTKLPNGTYSTSTAPTYTVSSNGTYTFTVYDHAGNSKTISAAVTKIDKTLPAGTISGNPTTWGNSNITLTLTASDGGGSGYYQTKLPDGTYSTSAKPTYTVTSNGTYTFTIYDNAGNSQDVSATVSKIEKVVPGGSISGNPTVWTNQNATLTLTPSDTGGSGYYRTKLPDGTYSTNVKPAYTVSSNGTYTFTVYDHAGNSKTVSAVVTMIDKTIPGGAISGNPTSWTNQNPTLTLSPSDGGGSGYYRTKLPDGTFSNHTKPTYTVTSNGTYTFVVYDHAGNSKNVSVTVTKIDKTLPTLGKTEIKNVTQDSFDVYVYDVADAGGSQVNRVQFPTWTSASGQDDLLSDWTTNAKATGENMGNGTWRFTVNRSTHNYEFGDYIIHIYAFDNAGNRRSVGTTHHLRDQVKPTISVTGNPVTWGNGDITLTVKGYDAHTGVKSITLPDGTVITKNGAKGQTVSHTYRVDKNGSYTFKVTDMYDNVVTQTIAVGKIDKTEPTLGVSNNATNWTNKDITLTVTGSDGASGVARIILPNGVVVNQNKATYVVKENGKYTFTVSDVAGNKVEKTETVNRIDKTIPSQSTIEIEVN